jgi:hypothetical protein
MNHLMLQDSSRRLLYKLYHLQSIPWHYLVVNGMVEWGVFLKSVLFFSIHGARIPNTTALLF